MSFSERDKSSEEKQCPICRQPIKDGRVIQEKAYMDGTPICRACYRDYYMNRARQRTVGTLDDTAVPLVRFKPAAVLERDPIFHKEPPACGYDFPLPQITIEQTIRDAVFWILFCAAVLLAHRIGCGNSHFGILQETSLSYLLLKYVLPGVSLVLALSYLWKLIRGILYGIGHTRRLVLAGAVIAMVLTGLLCLK